LVTAQPSENKEKKMRKRLDSLSLFFLAVIAIHPGALISSKNELLAQNPSQGKDGKVNIRVVKYDGLKQAVTDFKGKLVVVDFWSTT
jgi:hypothetical protein